MPKIVIPKTDNSAWTFEERPGGWVLATRPRGDGSLERIKFQTLKKQGKLSLSLDGKLWFGDAVRQDDLDQQGAQAADGGADVFVAQFPGKVRKVLVKAGQATKAGESLLLLEAMKMEFAIKAPRDGIVKAVLVQEGAQVTPGLKLLDYEMSEK